MITRRIGKLESNKRHKFPGRNRSYSDLWKYFKEYVAAGLLAPAEDNIFKPVSRYGSMVRPCHEPIHWWWMDGGWE